MSVLIVLLLAILSRVLPVALHSQSWNFSLLGGSLLFLGSRMAQDSPRRAAWKIGGVLAAMVVTDYCITVYGYRLPFHYSGVYLTIWMWYAGMMIASMGLFRKLTAVRVVAGAVAGPTSFFLLSNFAVWAAGMYAHTTAGLAQCYIMGLPFYRNDLVSTGLTAVALFGLPAVAARIAESFHAADHNIAA